MKIFTDQSELCILPSGDIFIKIAHGQFALYELVRHVLLFGKDLVPD